jgi:phage gp29-like protein
MEIKEAVKNSGNTPHGYLIDIADLAADLLILGQTLTSTAGDRGSQALGQVHYAVRADIISHVAHWAAKIINYQLIPSIAQLNFGNTDDLPWLDPQIEQPIDQKAQVERDKILFQDMGLPVAKQWLYERHGVPVPSSEDDLFQAPAATAPALAPGISPNLKPAHDMSPVEAKAEGRPDRLLDAVMEELTGVQARWTAPVRDIWQDLILKAQDTTLTDEELVQAIEASANRMPELFGKLPATDEVRDLMERAMGAALVEGATRREDAGIFVPGKGKP